MKEETHTCCNKRLKEEGGKARCCYCVPHDDCELKYEVKRYYLKDMTKNMTSNLEQLKKEFEMALGLMIRYYSDGLAVDAFKKHAEIKGIIDKAFALGTLNGLDKAIELMPEENLIAKNTHPLNEFYNGFNKCRSQILSKIKEERKLWN